MADVVDVTPALELGMQELETMEAPGFWTGFLQTVGGAAAISGAAAASFALT